MPGKVNFSRSVLYFKSKLDDISVLLIIISQFLGVFSYDFTLGEEFQSIMPREFIHLRTSINKHQYTAIHTKSLTQSLNAAKLDTQIKKKVFRSGYFLLKNSLPYNLFPKLLHLQNVNGLQVGNKNHSPKFINNIRTDIRESCLKKIEKFVESSAGVSLMGDKVTVHGKNYEVLAMQLLVPCHHKALRIQSVVLGVKAIM